MNNTHSTLGLYLLGLLKNLGWPVRERADALTMIDDGVTNLGGKSLSKQIHWFTNSLTKML